MKFKLWKISVNQGLHSTVNFFNIIAGTLAKKYHGPFNRGSYHKSIKEVFPSDSIAAITPAGLKSNKDVSC